MTRHELVKAVEKRIDECRKAGFSSDHAIATNVVGVFEEHVRTEFGVFGLTLIFAPEPED